MTADEEILELVLDGLSTFVHQVSPHFYLQWDEELRGNVSVCTCTCAHEPIRNGCTACKQVNVCRCEGVLARPLIECVLQRGFLYMTLFDERAVCGQYRKTFAVHIADPYSLDKLAGYILQQVKDAGLGIPASCEAA